ncbi:MAG: DM13 domain-containing protein [Gammaproteobacteria bacterium]
MNRRNFFTLAITLAILIFITPPAPARAAEILASGAWNGVNFDIRGNWEIISQDGARYIRFDKNFKTRKGPDLKVYLSPDPVALVKERSVASRSLEVAALAAHRGAQQFEIPAHADLADYRSLLIHCKAYAHLWGGADITQ